MSFVEQFKTDKKPQIQHYYGESSEHSQGFLNMKKSYEYGSVFYKKPNLHDQNRNHAGEIYVFKKCEKNE